MNGCRIGKIKLKAGGAEVRILERPERPDGESWAGAIVQNAQNIAGFSESGCELAGYFIIGLFSDGGHASGFRWDSTKVPFDRRLLPGFVAEIVREKLITEACARTLVNQANGYED